MANLRRVLLTAGAAMLAAPVLAQSARVLPGMTEGPFYPPRRWRDSFAGGGDWDADLTRTSGSGPARGEHLALWLQVADARGRAVDDADVEIWQCDALAAYRHPSVPLEPGRHDPAFQGFGAVRSARDGSLKLRTIRPVPYPGRTPHIHVTVRHPSFGELTSQLFVAGDPGNARDFLWRRLDAEAQGALAMTLMSAEGDGLRWQARHTLIVPA
ncbi:dioxygenase family protein [Rubrivivax albus]|uniref:Intradiol ring-cleavage dioxygenase n=1 Tax=Rubrivivax albus TaxID=2499835 RepID=A0A437JZN8_9BURK|nr:intradiol ring-cleavage dioxygenase [Rubrivivax albus]RVT53577.1 intradiol ring-cleavage dioxygenase [Rubrivivax albus]